MIDANNSKMTVMASDYKTFISTRLMWSAILSEINDLTPKSKITIATVTLQDTGVKIDGSATKRQYIIDYETSIEASPFFKDVTFSFEDSTAGEMVIFKITAPFDMSYISSTNLASFNSSK
jgi:Tfp pilus assembly protein PilN